MRLAVVALATVPLAACSSVDGSDFGSLYDAVRTGWSGSKSVTLEEAAAAPYASIGVRIGDSSEAMLVLASDMGESQLWTSSTRVAITTRNGRIVRTAGLTHNLGGWTSLAGGRQNDHSILRWQADLPDLGHYSVLITCRETDAGPETITILGKDLRTRRIEEACQADDRVLDWSFRNVFWTDPNSAFMWRSIQHVNPKLDPIEIEVLRPPA
jgi:hypothetical protein